MDFILTTKLCQSTSHLTKKLNQVRRTSLENMSNNTQSSKKKDLKVKTPKKRKANRFFSSSVGWRHRVHLSTVKTVTKLEQKTNSSTKQV